MSKPTDVLTIGEEWAAYLDAIVPAGASAGQIEECKRAFYAGAQAMYAATLAAVGDDDDAVCEARIDALGREMSDFLRLFKVREGV